MKISKSKSEGHINGIHKSSSAEYPLISVITVVFNGEKYIEQTILSVINQTYKNIEYIIIDGASTDGTCDIIKNYEDKIAYWISEPDKGIYYAMNKGIMAVNDKNSYILFLNADDYLYGNSSIERIVSKIKNEDFIYGKILSIGNSTSVLLGKELTLDQLSVSMIQHQSTFVKKRLFDDLGIFNSSYKIAADFDFAIRVMKSKFSKQFINEIVAVMRMGGAGSKNYQITFREKSQIISCHYKGFNKIKALLYFNLYEMPKYFLSNLLSHLGLLRLFRRCKKSLYTIQS